MSAMRSGSRGLLLGCGVLLIACSPAPDFGGEPGASTASTSTGITSSSTAGTGGGGADGGGDAASAGGAGPSAGGGGAATPATTSTGGPPECETDDDCPIATDPCTTPMCGSDGRCGVAPLPVGTDGGACGVCQGGAYAGTCGYRVYVRPFPDLAGAAWSSQPMSEVVEGENAPPPTGITEVEDTASGRLFVFGADGMVHEAVDGGWLVPVPIATRFPSFPVDARVALAAMWRPSVESDDESALITTDEPTPRALSYQLLDGGATIVLESGPTELTPTEDPDAPPQHRTPYAWGFTEQRGDIGTSDDWVVFWAGMDGVVYQYLGGNFDYLAPQPDATSAMAMDGMGAAPAPGTAAATWHRDGVVYVLAP